MAILSSNETLESRRASGRFRESNTYTRSFLVQTDRTDESLLDIGASCGISYGDPHPDDSAAYCIGFDVQPVSGDMCLLYNVNFEYGIPPVENISTAGMDVSSPAGGGGGTTAKPTINPSTIPVDNWTGRSVIQSVQSLTGWTDNAAANTQDEDAKVPIRNTAGTIFPSGVELQEVIQEFRLERCYSDLSFLDDIESFSNRCNLDTFLGKKPGMVLCKGASWSKVVENNQGTISAYWRVNWSFEVGARPWYIKLASIGYMELKGGKKVPILDDDGVPVAEPANLDASGAATSGFPAFVNVYPHPQVFMEPTFGNVA